MHSPSPSFLKWAPEATPLCSCQTCGRRNQELWEAQRQVWPQAQLRPGNPLVRSPTPRKPGEADSGVERKDGLWQWGLLNTSVSGLSCKEQTESHEERRARCRPLRASALGTSAHCIWRWRVTVLRVALYSTISTTQLLNLSRTDFFLACKELQWGGHYASCLGIQSSIYKSSASV